MKLEYSAAISAAKLTLFVALGAAAAFWSGRWFAAPTAPERKLHVSRFVFRDVNRNGRYDLGERPFGGLPVRMVRPDGTGFVVRSNFSGFANFNMSAGSRKHPVSQPGAYATEPVLREGWLLTTAPARETVEFRLDPLAPAGIFADGAYTFIGIAPAAQVILPPGFAERHPFLALKIDSRETAGAKAADGSLVFDAGQGGEAELAGRAADGTLATTRFAIGGYPALFSRHFPLGAAAPEGKTVTVGFDDLIASNTLRETPSGYAGYDWRYWIATQDRFYKLYGHLNNTVSGDYFAYTSSGHAASVMRAQGFDFVGVHIAVTHAQAESGDAILEGYSGSTLRYSERLRLRSDRPYRFLAEWRGIDRLTVRHEHHWHIAIDDLELRKR